MKLAYVLAAGLALSAAAVQAQPQEPPTELPGLTVQPQSGLPAKPCNPTDRACYATVAKVLKTQYPEVYWQLAVKCMNEQMQQMRMHANPLIDGSASDSRPPTPGGAGLDGDIRTQTVGEKTFCAIAQSDARPPPKSARR